jgi:tetratricopeptide (TPR) repeat protein
MNRATSSLLLALLCAATLSAQPKWIHMENENFNMYSSASERDSLAALNYFERVRGFFIQMTGAPPSKPVPVYVVMFGSQKEYLPYRFNEFAIAYYAGQSDRDFIVMGKTGEQTAQAATHEYTHLVMKHSGFTLPPWLNEGLAELFSTMHPLGDNTLFGETIPGRLQGLYREAWVPLTAILTADRNSPYYNETKRAGTFYNESWALVHMLETTDEYRPKFWDMVQIIQDGTPSVQALEKVYGVPLAKIEADLRFYIKGSSFKRLVTKIKLENIDKLKAQPADMFDVRTLDADLLMSLPGKQADARTRFEELTREDAKRPEPWSGLGYLAWRDGKQDDAVANFAKAYQLGDRSPKLLWDYGRLAERNHPEDAIRAFTELVAAQPKDTDVLLELANMQMNLRQYPAALATTRAVTSVKTAEQRDRVLYIRAFAATQSGERSEGRARAEELKRLTTAPEWAARADDLLRFLNQPERRVAAPQEPRVTTGVLTQGDEEIVERPALRQRESQPVTRDDLEIILQDIRGTLLEMDCREPARFILQTGQGRKTFLILQPDRMVVTGRTGQAQFECGPQKPATPLRLQFTIAPEGSDADGVVRAVHFGDSN